MSFADKPVLPIIKNVFSIFLEREAAISVILPIHYDPSLSYPLVLFNDGQDFEGLGMAQIAARLQESGATIPFLIAGIHANENRIYEYGVAAEADYAGRGNRAGATSEFVTKELLPFLNAEYHVSQEHIVYAGFSLGGLMALDIVWNNPQIFSKAGVFSGSLWWRKRALHDGYDDSDRIMHTQLQNADEKPGLQFWFQCGSLDEYDDRDGDGVIDSIQDTLECIAILEKKGYAWNRDVFYKEVALGEHNLNTWSEALPDFFKWAFSGK
ncbi:alpha/beta hydrolase-fold protein [Dyadobacter chenwenxiniae]|uniref:Esterase family protein n=1 Tax=Dyadobacter chenwenxiniae TaxID=2906456 RepID=A0A9X1PLS6_9BACT|nr:alpha/beta hydrolase-fold protein [Dyadobacter chenwenxiniae]MCF0062750.1 esterase family protein [Dyadobacter chenwenxiniae]UON85073.1 alpha/beta hydrolase-fold protein [Dyadobacter chenwenxiniae]